MALRRFSCRLIRGQCAIAPRQLATTLLLALVRSRSRARTRLPTRVPAALCACRAWDRHCLLLFVLSFPGHGRSRRLDLADRNRFYSPVRFATPDLQSRFRHVTANPRAVTVSGRLESPNVFIHARPTLTEQQRSASGAGGKKEKERERE